VTDPATGTEELPGLECTIYPNPFSGVLYISSISDTRVKVFSMKGDILYQNDHLSQETQADLRFLPAGVYIVVVDDGMKKVSHKIIKN
jgi:hypothetical protein